MKNIIWVLGIVVLISSCKDKVHQKYIANSPVYTDYETFRNSGGFEASRSIEQQGNIYFKDGFLFMVEPDKGIHFIDNTNPSAPIQKGFLNIWGATGMAIKGDFLYANSFIDLVVYDISSFANPTLVERLEDVFPGALPFSEKNYPYKTIDKSKGVVTSWTTEEVTEDVANFQPTWIDCFNCEVSFVQTNGTFDSGTSGGGTGISGSISLFTIIDDYLYVVENGSLLHPFEISNPVSPNTNDPVYLWGNVETLFPHNEYIFMGTPSGMLVYETSNPTVPTYVSALSHARGCDPVVVQGDYAYVTVRSGGPCGGDINQLDVIDISTIEYPLLAASFNLKNPHGLGIDGTSLFVCDGEDGLKVFDATNPLTAGDNELYKFKNIQATDIIPVNDIAIVIGEDGIYQYDYSDLGNITLLSSLNF